MISNVDRAKNEEKGIKAVTKTLESAIILATKDLYTKIYMRMYIQFECSTINMTIARTAATATAPATIYIIRMYLNNGNNDDAYKSMDNVILSGFFLFLARLLVRSLQFPLWALFIIVIFLYSVLRFIVFAPPQSKL